METARKIPEHGKRVSKKKKSDHYEKITERVTNVGVILPSITKTRSVASLLQYTDVTIQIPSILLR